MIHNTFIIRVLVIVISCGHFIGVNAMQVKASEHAKMKMCVCVLGKKTSALERVAEQLAKDFSFTKQFAVTVDSVAALVKNVDVTLFYQAGIPLVLFVSKGKKGSFEWRLYDSQRAAMLMGKVYEKRGKSPVLWAHHIADAVWPVLTGQPGFFSTKIAYSKEVRRKGKKAFMHIYCADYDGSNEKLLVDLPTLSVSPRWNKDAQNPLIFYSEHTNKNVRLIAVDMQGKRKVVSNFDGVNMQVGFSPDGKRAVFSSSRGGQTCQLYYFEKGNLKKITNNCGNNIAPSFSDDSQTLYFCSDYQTGNPQVYKYGFVDGKIERITEGGYCVSPSYCQKNDTLAYSKMVSGTMQIFVYDIKAKKHQQLTFDAGNKDECSWSPCGNYLLFSVEKGRESRLAIFNRITKDQQLITAKGSICCYPSWSIPYNAFPLA